MADYYIESGVTSTGINLSYDDMYVSNGGVASATTVDNGGWLIISSGGVANDTTVSSGYMYILSGGTALNVTWTPCVGGVYAYDGAVVTYTSQYQGVYFGSNNKLLSSAMTMSGEIVARNSMYVMQCGVANYTTVGGGQMYISSGGVANHTTVSYGGHMDIDDGGVANYTTVNSGYLYISSGGVANDTTVSSGYMYISSGGVVNSTTVSYGGDMYLLSGGVASSTTVDGGGDMYLLSGGVATATTVSRNGDLSIASGGIAYDVTILDGGRLDCFSWVGDLHLDRIENGSVVVADHVTVIGSTMYILSGGVANNTTVNSGGYMFISSGGVANNTGIDSGGYMFISSGGVANATGVYPSGYMHILSGGVANETRISYFGFMYIDGGVANETSIRGGDDWWKSAVMSILSGGVANDTTVNRNGSMLILSGGVASSTTISSGGYMFISSGGEANTTTINSWSNMLISSGGVANTTTISGGGLYISSGGVADEIIVNGGYMYISSGGTALNVTWTPGEGAISAYDGAMVTYTSQYQGVYCGSYYNTFLSSAMTMTGKTVNGCMYVFDGGVANETTINGDSWTGSAVMTILSGGVANLTTVTSGSMTISRGGVANYTTVNLRGSMYISSGGVANGTVVRGDNARMLISRGGVANSTTVSYGSICISSGGVANSTTINSGGRMYISGGGAHRGLLQIADGAAVSAYAGSVIDFTVSGRTAEDGYLINDLSRIQGTPDYTITVSTTQASGTYVLAADAAGFDKTVTVVTDAGIELGELAIGSSPLVVGNHTYELALLGAALYFTVAPPELDPPTDLVGSQDGLSWAPDGAERYVVEYTTDGFTHALSVTTGESGLDSFAFSAGDYVWRVRAEEGSPWSENAEFVSDGVPDAPQVIAPAANGIGDLFFANAKGVWEGDFAAKHVGVVSGWAGTGEKVTLVGKNKLVDVFEGSTDTNILVMTDGAEGDALFVDDIYSAFPDKIAAQSRLARIDEVRAGAGDDIVDMTSQRFEYIGEGLTIRGGDGNDTIWATSGENFLFGDAGTDRVVGASGDDVIAGGIGDDSMHGGGGSDLFAFCSDWGVDTVEQLSDGDVTLWFASGSMDHWDASTLTYTEGNNTVTVSGVTADRVTLKFGDDESEEFAQLAAAGAFAAYTSARIFETEEDRALLAAAV